MFGNSSGAGSGSYSLTFLGKKVGRHRSVAPAGTHHAWEKPNGCSDDPEEPVRSGLVPAAVQVVDALPGSVPELQEDLSRPVFHNTPPDNAAGVTGRKLAA